MSRRKIIITIGILLCVAIFIPIVRHYQLRAATQACIAQLKAKGEPMELAQVIPPPVPPEKNDAPLFLKAASVINTNWDVLGSNPPPAMQMVAPGKAMIGWAQSEIRSEDGINSWGDVRVALAKENGALYLLQQITNHLRLDFNLDYAGGYDKIKMLYLASLKRAAQGLSASAIFDLHRGDSVSAIKATHSMLLLANAMQHDHLIISELVRMAIAQMALAVNWEILQATNITDEQLVELQHDWMSLDFIRGDENALEMERVTGEITLAKWRNSYAGLQHYFTLEANARKSMGLDDEEDTLWDKAKITTKIFLWRWWWSYPDELRCLKGYDALINGARSAQTNGSFLTALHYQNAKLDELGISKIDDEFLAFFSSETDFHSMLSQSIVGLSGVIRKVMSVEVARQTVMIAIALKRYQLKHGNYPADLNSLVPEFISTVPLDPVDGQPLRYRKNADGTFLLYSVGENGVDDGGDPSLEKGVTSSNYSWQNIHAVDWVWPQPATEAEIQAYYKKISAQSN